MTRYLTYAEAANFLRLPIGSLRAMVHAKRIPHVRIGPRTVTFELADLERWLAERRVTP
jgi:excisionase family DNA binding protein